VPGVGSSVQASATATGTTQVRRNPLMPQSSFRLPRPGRSGCWEQDSTPPAAASSPRPGRSGGSPGTAAAALMGWRGPTRRGWRGSPAPLTRRRQRVDRPGRPHQHPVLPHCQLARLGPPQALEPPQPLALPGRKCKPFHLAGGIQTDQLSVLLTRHHHEEAFPRCKHTSKGALPKLKGRATGVQRRHLPSRRRRQGRRVRGAEPEVGGEELHGVAGTGEEPPAARRGGRKNRCPSLKHVVDFEWVNGTLSGAASSPRPGRSGGSPGTAAAALMGWRGPTRGGP